MITGPNPSRRRLRRARWLGHALGLAFGFAFGLGLSPLGASVAEAHGDQFGAAQLSVNPDDTAELWALIPSFGLVHSRDGGAAWAWTCLAGFDTTRAYAVLSVGSGFALVTTTDGVVRVGEDCEHTLLEGIPGFGGPLARDGDEALVGVSGTEQGGVYRCTGNLCAPTQLQGPQLFVKSLLATDRGFLATVVEGESFAATLWSSPDGDRWTALAGWPDGSLDPTLFFAREDTVLLWAHPRDEGGQPALLRSDDGGLHFSEVYSTGSSSDPVAGFAAVDGGETLLLGPGAGQTLRSTDDGRSWSDVSGEAPEVVCGESVGDETWICTDHVQDGVSIMVTEDARTYVPVACLEEATPAACAEATCEDQLLAYTYSAISGGGRCDIILRPDPPDEGSDGCGGRASLLLWPIGLWLRALRRPRRDDRRPSA